MNKSTVRPTKKSARKNFIDPEFAKKLSGYILISLGSVLFVTVCAADRGGLLGGGINRGLRYLFGLAAFPFSLSLAYFGLAVFRKGSPGFETKRLWGAALFVVSLAILCNLWITSENLSECGGLLGSALSYLLDRLIGIFKHAAGVILLAVSAFLLAGKAPKEVFDPLLQRYREEKALRDARKRNHEKPVVTEDQQTRRPEPDPRPEKQEVLLPPVKPQKPSKPVGEVMRMGFRLPSTELLAPSAGIPEEARDEIESNREIIQNTLAEFGVEANVVRIASGPTVSRYEVELAHGIKVNKITSLADNLAMSLAAINVRIEAPIPGKSAIGVEVPNKKRAIVGLRGILESELFQKSKYQLPFVLGADVAGNPRIADLAKTPHLLIAGATGSGKSVGLNTLITSLLYKLGPDELRLVLIDPKRVELSLYDGIPHLAHPVVKDVKLAAGVLEAVVQEMQKRYMILEQQGSRNIAGYNAKAPEDGKMPYMVVVIDELSDLMMQCAKNVETSICRLAQLSRAVGIHLVVATQRPSVDVITGKIKANIPSRIAFSVSSYIDSKTIIDTKGAESLIGYGDMLYAPTDEPKPVRIQGCYLSEDEITGLCDYLREQREPSYELEAVPVGDSGGSGGDDEEDTGSVDNLWNDAVRTVVSSGYCSTSILQRKFSIGYNRAARIVDRMEQEGIVGPLDGAKARRVLITEAELTLYLKGVGGE
ncbi:MAG: DNA translocase FtsK 4TM domain-containing protein [Abditibacteriota bacterium]|nr:DNA translocase FtsK 4TM domain-containing protein [Abditibacteriota bacterium]